jgi:hypothetical protein
MQIVRKLNAAGKCIELGKLVRATRLFFVVDGPNPQKRIAKDNAHLEPCRRCKDYQAPPPEHIFRERAKHIAAMRQQRIEEERKRLSLAGRRR